MRAYLDAVDSVLYLVIKTKLPLMEELPVVEHEVAQLAHLP